MNQTEPLPRQELVRHRCSTQHFLLSRTNTVVHRSLTEQMFPAGCRRLMEAFPDVLAGSTFLDHALEHLQDAARFDVAAVRIDNFRLDVARSGRDPNVELQQRVARTVERVCRELGGMWGILDADIFGLFFETAPDAAAQLNLEAFHDKFTAASPATVSIGLASYPSLDYDRSHILENALKAIDHAAFFGPGSTVAFDAVSLNISGDQLYQSGDVTGAIEEFENALKLDPASGNVLNSLGVCYAVLEQYQKSLAVFEKAMALDATEVMTVYNAGLVHMLIGDSDRALALFEQADGREELYETAFQTARILIERNEPEKAQPYIDKAIRLNPESAAAYRYLGDCRVLLEDLRAALDAYRTAVKKHPNDAAALSALGHLLMKTGENPEIAALFCRQSVTIEPENGEFRSRFGKVLARQGLLQDALEQFHRATELGHDAAGEIADIERQLTN